MKNNNTVRKTESALKQFQRWVNLNKNCSIITNDLCLNQTDEKETLREAQPARENSSLGFNEAVHQW